jgi:hypothetical protein
MVFLLAAPKLNQQGYRYVNQTQVQDEAEEYMDIVQVLLYISQTSNLNKTHESK